MDICKPWEYAVIDKPTSAIEKLPVASLGPKDAYTKGLLDALQIFREAYIPGGRIHKDPRDLILQKLKQVDSID